MANMAQDSKQPITAVDRLYDAPRRRLVDFAFDDAVADVFPDMIRRSVPGYETVTALSGLIAARHLPAGGRCYDLGCSLGAATRAVLRAIDDLPCEIVAVDDSAAMVDRARRRAAGETRVRWQQADVRGIELGGADVVILNYVLQFLPRADRLPLLRRIRLGLADSGVLILSEKLDAPAWSADLHLQFKRANGYSDLAIAQKRAALENVMRVDSVAGWIAGFSEGEPGVHGQFGDHLRSRQRALAVEWRGRRRGDRASLTRVL